jgi:predicted  nucleic acid-binding Zn-ribbon protein
MKGECINCGTVFYGVSAIDPNKQKCIQCGGRIHILENIPPRKLADVPLRVMTLRKEGLD